MRKYVFCYRDAKFSELPSNLDNTTLVGVGGQSRFNIVKFWLLGKLPWNKIIR